MNLGEIRGYVSKVFKLFVKESGKLSRNYLWNETNLDLNLGSTFRKKNCGEAEFQTFMKLYRILYVEVLIFLEVPPPHVGAIPHGGATLPPRSPSLPCAVSQL